MPERSLSEEEKNLSRTGADCSRNDAGGLTVRDKLAVPPASSERHRLMKKSALKGELKPIFDEFDSLFKALSEK
ncbi:hypothetical protein MUN46_009010 [Mesosutterella sp. AGMB02718]|uniref:Uncharacterized protein n=1 Tax=Mesosutterella faecium TaxID=2925194 RepID=A0ABT7INV7_9BURK|nr:hypothetical protein [Mesosutterella sp. AGMB02718]MDL2060071.1 hypothetical protein [Mesosutterella sp. AGMB02718]